MVSKTFYSHKAFQRFPNDSGVYILHDPREMAFVIWSMNMKVIWKQMSEIIAGAPWHENDGLTPHAMSETALITRFLCVMFGITQNTTKIVITY